MILHELPDSLVPGQTQELEDGADCPGWGGDQLLVLHQQHSVRVELAQLAGRHHVYQLVHTLPGLVRSHITWGVDHGCRLKFFSGFRATKVVFKCKVKQTSLSNNKPNPYCVFRCKNVLIIYLDVCYSTVTWGQNQLNNGSVQLIVNIKSNHRLNKINMWIYTI